MKRVFLLFGALALPMLAGAQASVTDAAAPVPAVLYRSVFADTPTGVEMESIDWKAANAEVGQFKNGHVDILKWEAAQPQAKGSRSMPMPMHHPAPPAAPAAAGAPGAIKPSVKP